MQSQTKFHRLGAPRGFTLVEVMISVALVLIIILGVNQVFAMTSQVVGAGQSLSAINRDARSVQSIFHRDLGNAEVDRAPYFIINSESLAAFRNVADQLTDLDFDVTDRNQANTDRRIRTIDRNENGNEADDAATPRAFMTSRTHRADQLFFFTRSHARRQTGDTGSFTSGVSSSEQYIVYGLLRQPRNDGSTQNSSQPGLTRSAVTPGTGCETPATNPNNYYATQWVLGRKAQLLRDPEITATGTHVIRDYSLSTPKDVTYYGRSLAASNSRAPFSEGTGITKDGTIPPGHQMFWSHYDLIGMSMDRYRSDILPGVIAGNGPTWHNEMVFRFAGFPAPTKPLSSEGVARTVPCLLQGCTQFAVEYAGDFISQDPSSGTRTGVANGTGGGTDGEVDYIVQSYTLNGQAQRSRRIRWYGFPRDTHGALSTFGANTPALANADKPDGFVHAEDDVVPLRDIAGIQFPFEQIVPTVAAPPTSGGSPRPSSPDYGSTSEAIPLGGTYRCVWTPADPASSGYPNPTMIRITMAIDDPAGRIGAEQYFEFIIELSK